MSKHAMRIKTEVPKKILQDMEIACMERPGLRPDGKGTFEKDFEGQNKWDNSARSVVLFFKERLFE